MDIADWRNKIDQVDSELLKLLNQRARCAIEIGVLKQKGGIPVYSPDREERIISRLLQENAGPMKRDSVQRIFERIIDESRKLEKDVSNLKNGEPDDGCCDE